MIYFTNGHVHKTMHDTLAQRLARLNDFARQHPECPVCNSGEGFHTFGCPVLMERLEVLLLQERVGVYECV
jgi:hypothetical protein